MDDVLTRFFNAHQDGLLQLGERSASLLKKLVLEPGPHLGPALAPYPELKEIPDGMGEHDFQVALAVQYLLGEDMDNACKDRFLEEWLGNVKKVELPFDASRCFQAAQDASKMLAHDGMEVALVRQVFKPHAKASTKPMKKPACTKSVKKPASKIKKPAAKKK